MFNTQILIQISIIYLLRTIQFDIYSRIVVCVQKQASKQTAPWMQPFTRISHPHISVTSPARRPVVDHSRFMEGRQFLQSIDPVQQVGAPLSKHIWLGPIMILIVPKQWNPQNQWFPSRSFLGGFLVTQFWIIFVTQPIQECHYHDMVVTQSVGDQLLQASPGWSWQIPAGHPSPSTRSFPVRVNQASKHIKTQKQTLVIYTIHLIVVPHLLVQHSM